MLWGRAVQRQNLRYWLANLLFHSLFNRLTSRPSWDLGVWSLPRFVSGVKSLLTQCLRNAQIAKSWISFRYPWLESRILAQAWIPSIFPEQHWSLAQMPCCLARLGYFVVHFGLDELQGVRAKDRCNRYEPMPSYLSQCNCRRPHGSMKEVAWG